jgi:hypothetical protein
MEFDETRMQLARQGAQLEEIAKNVSRLLDLSENLARMQERESDRDEKINRLFNWHDAIDSRHQALEHSVTASTWWARGVLAVTVAILLPVSGAVLWEVMHDLPVLDRRVLTLELSQGVRLQPGIK